MFSISLIGPFMAKTHIIILVTLAFQNFDPILNFIPELQVLLVDPGKTFTFVNILHIMSIALHVMELVSIVIDVIFCEWQFSVKFFMDRLLGLLIHFFLSQI